MLVNERTVRELVWSMEKWRKEIARRSSKGG